MPGRTRSNQRDAVALPKIKKLRNFGPTSAWDARVFIALNVVSNETHQNLDPLSLLPKEWIERTPQDEHWEYARNIFSLSRRILAENEYRIAQANELATMFYDDMRQLLRRMEKELQKEKELLNKKEIHWGDMDFSTEEQELQSSVISGVESPFTQDDVNDTRDPTSEEEDEEDVPVDFQIPASDNDEQEKEKENDSDKDQNKEARPGVRFASGTAEEPMQAGPQSILKNSWDSDNSSGSDWSKESASLENKSVKAIESYLRIILEAVDRGATPDHPKGRLILSTSYKTIVAVNFKVMKSENDGAIIRSRDQIPLVGIEAKAYYSTKTPRMRQNVHAQEFGECLAIVQARHSKAQSLGLYPTLQERTVYMVSIHHRRAYLSVVTFDPAYLANIQRPEGGYLPSRYTAVVRFSRKFRLDLEDDRLKLGWALYILCKNVDRP